MTVIVVVNARVVVTLMLHRLVGIVAGGLSKGVTFSVSRSQRRYLSSKVDIDMVYLCLSLSLKTGNPDSSSHLLFVFVIYKKSLYLIELELAIFGKKPRENGQNDQ